MTETVTVLSLQTGMATSRACELVGLARSTYYRASRGYRHYQPVATPVPQAARFQPSALTRVERDQIIAVLTHLDGIVDPGADLDGIVDPGADEEAVEADLSVHQIYWRAFDAGLLSCSQRTFYRVAARHQLVGDRRGGGHGRRGGRGRRPPAVAATRPNELWSWDATELVDRAGNATS